MSDTSEELTIPGTIWVITQETSDVSTNLETSSDTGSKGVQDTGGVITGRRKKTETSTKGRVAISVKTLKQNMSQFLAILGEVFFQAEQQAAEIEKSSQRQGKLGGIQLEQIELSVDINAKGEVNLLGIGGGEVGGKGAIKLTFKRKES